MPDTQIQGLNNDAIKAYVNAQLAMMGAQYAGTEKERQAWQSQAEREYSIMDKFYDENEKRLDSESSARFRQSLQSLQTQLKTLLKAGGAKADPAMRAAQALQQAYEAASSGQTLTPDQNKALETASGNNPNVAGFLVNSANKSGDDLTSDYQRAMLGIRQSMPPQTAATPQAKQEQDLLQQIGSVTAATGQTPEEQAQEAEFRKKAAAFRALDPQEQIRTIAAGLAPKASPGSSIAESIGSIPGTEKVPVAPGSYGGWLTSSSGRNYAVPTYGASQSAVNEINAFNATPGHRAGPLGSPVDLAAMAAKYQPAAPATSMDPSIIGHAAKQAVDNESAAQMYKRLSTDPEAKTLFLATGKDPLQLKAWNDMYPHAQWAAVAKMFEPPKPPPPKPTISMQTAEGVAAPTVPGMAPATTSTMPSVSDMPKKIQNIVSRLGSRPISGWGDTPAPPPLTDKANSPWAIPPSKTVQDLQNRLQIDPWAANR